MDNQEAHIQTDPVKTAKCPNCGGDVVVEGKASFSQTKCPACGKEFTVPAQFGHFLLLKMMGHGGMGGVFLGHDQMLDRQVAIKVMLKSLGDDPKFVERFQREAQAAAKLNHPNIAQIYSFGQEHGQPYIAMELVSGGALDKMMEKEPGKLDPAFVMRIGSQIAAGLSVAAESGLVHGDVKPENVLFDAAGNAKLVDFGLAAMQGDSQEIWGTPYYISPEKVRRQPIDFRADIYSLGGTLYHALTGVPPFEGADAAAVVKARFNGPPKKPSDVRKDLPKELDDIIIRMLEVEPSRRYPTYESLLGDINRYLAKAGPVRNLTGKQGRKIVLKGRVGRPLASTGNNSTVGGIVPEALSNGVPLGSEPPPPANIGAIVGAVVGGIILLVLLIVGGLAWYVHHSHVVEAQNHQLQIVDKQAEARRAIAGTLQSTHDFEANFRELCDKSIREVRETSDRIAKLLPSETAVLLVPPPPAALVEALAPPAAAVPTNVVPVTTNAVATAPAVTNVASVPAAPAPVRRVTKEYDPADPEAEKPAEPKPAEPAAQAPAVTEGTAAPAPEEKKAEVPPCVAKVQDLWMDAYVCSTAVVRIHNALDGLSKDAAQADQLKTEDLPTTEALGKLSQSLVERFEAIKGQQDVSAAQRKAGVIKSKAKTILESTLREIKRAHDKAEAEKKATEEAAAAKAAAEKAAAEHKALVDTETARVTSKYQGLTTTLLKHLDWSLAVKQLRGMRGELETAEGRSSLDAYVMAIERMQGLHEYFIKNIEGFTFKNGFMATNVNDKTFMFYKASMRPGVPPTVNTVTWDAFYSKHPGRLNELFIEFVELGRDRHHLGLMEWSNHMMGAALTLRTLYADQPSAAPRAESLVKKAVKDFPPCERHAVKMFPDLKFDAVPAE